ncbi:tetratricopeptide repeat protein [Lentzea sp. NPDC005914]|uniref:tetratricopeptide repeat protein n=1 Tax=Lentzea sp. NPDC005914 TaxID=3154572 RepID=UPI0033D3B2C4
MDFEELVATQERARAHHRAGDYLDAFRLHDEVLAAVVELVGPDHHVTVSALTALTEAWFAGWSADKRPDLAVRLWELTAAEWQRVVGPEDANSLIARNDLALVYLSAGQQVRAMKMLDQLLVDARTVLGADHDVTRLVQENVGDLAPLRSLSPDAVSAETIASAFADVLGLEAVVAGGRVSVEIAAIGETLHVPVCDVKRVTKSFTPMGDPALEFVMVENDDVLPLIVMADNVVFAPEDPVALLHSPIPVVISDAQPLTSYAEMLTAADRFAVEPAPGMCVYLRCVIAGALRFGLRSLPAVARWNQGWQALEPVWDLPPFPMDPVWDHLSRCAPVLPLPVAVADDPVAEVTAADFARLSIAQLDAEFVALWKALIPLHPAEFADVLLFRLDGRPDVTLYPDGTGSVDLVIRDGDEFRALLQLRFDLRARVMDIDELRIAETARGAGLFQRLQYNAEQLARALGLGSVNILATGIGSYAFAKARFPQDPELHAKIFP